MINNNSFFYFNKIIIQIAWKVLYFPIWWYTLGMLKKLEKAKNFLINKQTSLALLVWIKNINKPMYGQYDLTGMIVSFFMRLFQIIARSFILLLWTAYQFVLVVAWIILPIFVVYQIFFQLI